MNFTADTFRQRISEQLPLDHPERVEGGKLIEPQAPNSASADLSYLYEIPDTELFLREAYRVILGRKTDAYGFVRFREMLRNHVPKEVVIHHLVNSDEAGRSQRKFVGMRSLTGATGKLRYGLGRRLQSIGGTILLRFRNLIEIVMQGWRFDFLDVKMDAIKQELTAESAEYFHKTEESFWRLSEKLDRYVSDLQSRQAALLQEFAPQEHRLQISRSLSAVERSIEAGTRAHSVQLSGAVHRIENLETRLEGLEAAAAKQQSTAALASSSLERQIAHALNEYRSVIQTAIREVREALGEGAALAAAQNGTLAESTSKLIQAFSAHSQEARMMIAESADEVKQSVDNLGRLVASQFAEVENSHEQKTLVTDSVHALGAQLLDSLQESITTNFKTVERRFQPSVVHGGQNVIVTQVDGFIVGVPGEEWRVAAYHVFRGPLEPGLVRAFQDAIQPGMVVVDVGANIGVFTLYAARRTGSTGKVISFEPGPRPFEILKDNIQVNGFLETGIVDFRQAAVSDHAGTGELTVYADNSGHSTLFDRSASGEKIQVATQRLDDALADVPRVDVIKVDAEGAEPFVLRGTREVIRRNPRIRLFIEFAPKLLQRAGVSPAAFLDELAAMGLNFQVVDDLSGELQNISRSDLLRCYSINLSLSRSPGEAG